MLSSTASVPTTVATILRLRNAIAIPDRRTIDWDDRLHYGRRSSLSERCDREHVDGQHDEEGAETPFTGLSANERVSAMCSTGLVLMKWYPGYASAPHSYPTDRLSLVLSGTWWVNSGADFDPDATVPVPAGGFVRRVARTPHYDGV